MSNPLLKCTTRHVRIFTAIQEQNNLIEDDSHLTLDIDPDNEFLWCQESIEKVRTRFSELVAAQANKELSDYSLRKIGTDLESYMRKMLQAGELTYNPECRVLNYSMGLPRTPDLL
ncbi:MULTISPECIES: NAD(P)H-quinone oxidoreductase subunit M [unclassified Prochlorococcus]|uniref:NAD(P)H-quinone oxidoreductase subunit M n=1 Tax=unclassified Prochlorococcus TaxID=2627481 RepID=UPI0005337B98|nr:MULTISPECIES: NAD(P)H-quinone oxidoreductase subunit M [unclassified Prochlorococcus]KGG16793.1 putative subunit of NAD(P)H:quinone oxidoreductase [Prochlorococcus sp. MIT 0602]KGG18233.1 putative subunit of NAD(P)H:quinone oxidoreductase [Prochlorococcus sp. MIT 0603]